VVSSVTQTYLSEEFKSYAAEVRKAAEEAELLESAEAGS